MNTCKLDGLVIIIGSGSFADQMAQEIGFCGYGCQEVFQAMMESDKKEAAR